MKISRARRPLLAFLLPLLLVAALVLPPASASATVEEGPTDNELIRELFPFMLFPISLNLSAGLYNHLQDIENEEGPTGMVIAGFIVGTPTALFGGGMTGFFLAMERPGAAFVSLLMTGSAAYCITTSIMAASGGDPAPAPEAGAWQLAPMLSANPVSGDVTAGVMIQGWTF